MCHRHQTILERIEDAGIACRTLDHFTRTRSVVRSLPSNHQRPERSRDPIEIEQSLGSCRCSADCLSECLHAPRGFGSFTRNRSGTGITKRSIAVPSQTSSASCRATTRPPARSQGGPIERTPGNPSLQQTSFVAASVDRGSANRNAEDRRWSRTCFQ